MMYHNIFSSNTIIDNIIYSYDFQRVEQDLTLKTYYLYLTAGEAEGSLLSFNKPSDFIEWRNQYGFQLSDGIAVKNNDGTITEINEP